MSDLFKQLINGHYILYFNGEMVVTNKFYREFKTPLAVVPEEPKSIEVLPVVQKQEIAEIPKNPLSNAAPFIAFIQDAKIPKMIRTSAGGLYQVNAYNKDAEKEFLSILKSGIDYTILVKATELYYKSGGFPQKVANFIKEGTWRTFYQELYNSLEAGTADKHIEESIKEGSKDGYTRYKM